MSEDSNISRDLKPSEELLETIAEVRERYGRAKELVAQAYQLAIRDGFNPWQARDFLIAQLPFLGESTIRKALPPEAKEQSKVRLRSTVAQNTEPQESNIVNITTKAEIKDAELVNEKPYNPEEEIKKIGEIRRDLAKKDTEEDDAQALEIQFLKEKVAELEDALKKTEQFKPATDIVNLNPVREEPVTDELFFQWIQKKADGNGSFYYDSYGIDLFKSRELPQLKNRGVKVFKRLFFEV